MPQNFNNKITCLVQPVRIIWAAVMLKAPTGVKKIFLKIGIGACNRKNMFKKIRRFKIQGNYHLPNISCNINYLKLTSSINN